MKSQKESKQSIYDAIKDKVFLSNFSGQVAEVVKDLPEDVEDGKVLFDGVTLLDGIKHAEDDIQQVSALTKEGIRVNLEDYYDENGAYDSKEQKRFIAALEKLMTLEEYETYLEEENVPLETRIETFFKNQNNEKNHLDWEEDGIEEYTVNPDGSVDVKGNIFIDPDDLIHGHLPFKFGKVDGVFDADDSGLVSLWGAPEEVTGCFSFYDCNVEALEGCPRKVGAFFCTGNRLIDLEGCPQEVGGDFVCNDNNLLFLEGCPPVIHGDFECRGNNLYSSGLQGGPKEVEGNYDCSGCRLKSLKGAPIKVGGDFNCLDNALKSLEGLPATIGGKLISDFD